MISFSSVISGGAQLKECLRERAGGTCVSSNPAHVDSYLDCFFQDTLVPNMCYEKILPFSFPSSCHSWRCAPCQRLLWTLRLFFFNEICVWARTHTCVHLLHLWDSLCDFIAHKIGGGEMVVYNGSFSGLPARLVSLTLRCAVILIQRNYSVGSSPKGQMENWEQRENCGKLRRVFWFPLLLKIILWPWLCLHHFFVSFPF